MSLPSPTWLLRLADSELAALTRHDDGSAELLLAAALLRHPASGDWGHAPGLRLLLQGAQVSGEFQPGRVREGRIWLDGRWQAEWFVPGEWLAGDVGPLRLEWTGAYGDAVVLGASALRVALGDEITAGWRPWLHC